MELQPDYITVLKLATSKVGGSANDEGGGAEDGGDAIAFNITPRAGS
jgi:hypothetical protein